MKPPFPDDEPRRFEGDESDGRFPLTAGGVAMLLFLLSLTIFFAGGLFGYIYIRINNPHAPDWGEMNLPVGLWASTLVLVASGLTMHLAQRAASADDARRTRSRLALTLALGLAFLAIQAPALRDLLATHQQMLGDRVAVYGLTAFLIGLHAVHVLGGFVPLTWFTWSALRNTRRPDATSLLYLELYWHFLHIVWIIMFTAFIILR